MFEGKKVIISTYEFAKNYTNKDFYQGVRRGFLNILTELGLSWVIVHSGNAVEIFSDIEKNPEEYCGFIPPGGGDLYDDNYEGNDVDLNRDFVDYAFMKLAIFMGWPILGICRGFQSFSTLLGKSLIHEIDTDQQHSRPKQVYEYLLYDLHFITIKPETEVFLWLKNRYTDFAHNKWIEYVFENEEIAGIRVKVNSMHRHGNDIPTQGDEIFNVYGTADDNSIEFGSINTELLQLEDTVATPYDPFVMKILEKYGNAKRSSMFGVQWHPEAYAFYLEEYGQDHPLTIYLFEKFSVEALNA